MAAIPAILIQHGYESIGILSVHYYNLKKDYFIGGFYEKDKRFFLIMAHNTQSYIVYPISSSTIDRLMKDETDIMSVLYSTTPFQCIPFTRFPIIQHRYLLWRLRILRKRNQLNEFQNKYYRWNAYQHAQQIKQ